MEINNKIKIIFKYSIPTDFNMHMAHAINKKNNIILFSVILI